MVTDWQYWIHQLTLLCYIIRFLSRLPTYIVLFSNVLYTSYSLRSCSPSVSGGLVDYHNQWGQHLFLSEVLLLLVMSTVSLLYVAGVVHCIHFIWGWRIFTKGILHWLGVYKINYTLQQKKNWFIYLVSLMMPHCIDLYCAETEYTAISMTLLIQRGCGVPAGH